MRAKKATTRNVMITEVVALWQNPPKLSQAGLHVIVESPLKAKYRISVDTAPAPRIMYVSNYIYNIYKTNSIM